MPSSHLVSEGFIIVCFQIVDIVSPVSIYESMDSMSEIMIALRAGRALVGLNQEELAHLADVSRQIVVRIEKCEGNVLVESISKVRLALESAGVVFIEGCGDRGPAVALSRSLSERTLSK